MPEITFQQIPGSDSHTENPRQGWRKAAQECVSYLNKNKVVIAGATIAAGIDGVIAQQVFGDGNPVNNFGEFLRSSLTWWGGITVIGNLWDHRKSPTLFSRPSVETIAGLSAFALSIGLNSQIGMYKEANAFRAGDNIQEVTTKIDLRWSDMTRVITRRGEELTIKVEGSEPEQKDLTCTKIFITDRVMPREEARKIEALDVDMTKYTAYKTGACDFIDKSPVAPKRIVGERATPALGRVLSIE